MLIVHYPGHWVYGTQVRMTPYILETYIVSIEGAILIMNDCCDWVLIYLVGLWRLTLEFGIFRYKQLFTEENRAVPSVARETLDSTVTTCDDTVNYNIYIL